MTAYPDVLVLRGAWLQGLGDHPNSLLRNNGDGTFEDVTEAAGLLSYHPTQAAAWADYDNDGHLDLFIGNESTGSHIHPCELYRNNGDGTFSNLAASLGLARAGYVKGVAWGDYDNDGDPDLYLSRMDAGNLLYRNDGPQPSTGEGAEGKPSWRFVEVSRQAGVGEPRKSFATWFWDYDNDGWQDLFVAGYSLKPDFSGSLEEAVKAFLGLPHQGEFSRLFRNNGDGTFRDVSREAGLERALLTMGANFGDLDNDGFPDCYLGTGEPDLRTLIPNQMFRNRQGKVFQNVTTSGGFGHLQKGHGVSFGDIDNDGDQDIYTVMGGVVFRGCLPEPAFPQSGARQPLDHSTPGRGEDQPHGAGCAHQGDSGDRGGRSGDPRHCIHRWKLRGFQPAAGDRAGPGNRDQGC